MAKTIIASLNGGDLVTAANDLVYRIYGDVDGYLAPIKSYGSHITDSDVTVSGDTVTLIGLDGGANVSFKITSVDEEGNESTKSPLYSSSFYELRTTSMTDKLYMSLQSDWVLPIGGYIEFKYSIADTDQNPLISRDIDSDGNYNEYIIQSSETQLLLRKGVANTTEVVQGASISPRNSTHVYRFTRVSTGVTEHLMDGVVVPNVTTEDQIPNQFSTLFARNLAVPTDNSFTRGVFQYIDFNGDKLEFKHTGSVHVSNSGAITATLISGESSPLEQFFMPLDGTITLRDQKVTQAYDISAIESVPVACQFHPDGTYYYEIDNTANVINQYSLGSPWDISTITEVGKKTIGGAVSSSSSNTIGFKPDGTKIFMYENGIGYHRFKQWSLSTPWDISTAASMVLGTVLTYGSGMGGHFKPDGTRYYRCNSTHQNVEEYTLSTPWDVTTMSALPIVEQLLNYDGTGYQSLRFSSNGYRMILVGFGGYTREFELSTAWDITTAAYEGYHLQHSIYNSNVRGSYINDERHTLWLSGIASPAEVIEYDLTRP